MSVEDKKRLGRRFFKGYTKLVESKYWYNHYVALIFGASPASNLGSLIAIDWKGDEPISVTRFLGNNDNVKLYLGRNPETNMHELWLGLIGLDGDGSEFIIQSRESIDLDSKTVETLPSYLKVISISWQKNNDFSELGELIGTATGNKSGLMSVEDKKRLGRRFFKGYTKLVESKYWYNHYVALIFGASPASNLGSLIAIDWKGDEPISVTRFLGNNDNVKLYLGRNPETNMHELWLGLIGLDGDGSEFIIQSRESIDLDSKTVETLPSYLKVIPISWQKNNDFSELGELIGINETWFRNRGNIRGEINLDDFKNAGAYSLFDVEGNNVPTSWAQLLIFSSGYYIIQIIVDISSRKLFIRRYDTENDRWQEWGNIIIT